MSETTQPINDEQAADLAALEAAAASQPDAPGTTQQQPERIPTREFIAPMVGVLCKTLSAALPPEISQAEVDALTDAYAVLIDKYFPGGIELGPEIAALMITLAVFGPRFAAYKARKAVTPAPQPQQEQQQAA